MSPSVSIVILTLNEEASISDCLESVSVFDDVHLVDSGSTDKTIEIAMQKRVAVHHNSFGGFGQQRNWAIDHVPTKYAWQFHLDADERMTPALVAEINSVTAAEPAEAGYRVPSKLIFAGRW